MLSKLKPTILHRVLTVVTVLIFIPAAGTVLAQGKLEVPADDGSYSGILSFSGWACNPDSIEILIDGAVYIIPAYGTPRRDTEAVCGNYSTGFSYLINVANLGSGEHEAVLFVDGLELDRSSFSVTRLSTGEFARGLSRCAIVDDFPASGQEIELQWSEASQNFEIRSEAKKSPDTRLEGKWSNGFSELNIWLKRSSMDIDCVTQNKIYVGGYLGVEDVPQRMHLTGEGSSGSYLAESLPGDSANRILEFSLREDGRLKMYVKMCAATKNCVRSPEGSTYYFDKIANPLIGN